MGLKIAFAAAVATAALAASAQASTISTLPFWNGTTFAVDWGGSGGVTTGVYGETFTAPGSSIHSFTFEVNDLGNQIDNVFAEVYAWNGSLLGGNAPQGATGSALFTSAAFSISAVDGFQAVTVNTGSTPLTPGDNYVILLVDTGTDSIQSEFGLVQPGPGVALDGGFNFFNNDHTLGSVSGTWDDPTNLGSLAFSATFGGSPEPTSWALMMLGVGGVGLALRRRREGARIAG